MPRQATVAVENNFKQGLITQATGLNFPENACTEAFDCIFNLNGTVERRGGFDLEDGFITKTIDRDDVAISTFLWKNVSGDGDITLFVTQVGSTVYFWDTTGTAVSIGAIVSNIDLNTYLASGAPDPAVVECQFASTDKYLIVTHSYCDPFYVSYDSSSQTVTGTAITLKIRDFEGDPSDPLDIDTRTVSTFAALNVHHKYNLLNQGWIQTNISSWDAARTDMPSNADVMWQFKNSSGTFDTSTIANNMVGNTPAAKGHYILELADQDRDSISGLSGTTSKNTSYLRPSTCAVFAGRVFYAGVNYLGYNTDIYFTQILERDEQLGFCYQSNDPTSEESSDLLPSDGGVIRIKEAGTVFKVVSIAGSLVVFANNGVWTIGGSTGIGFTANDYTVQKISSISAISSTSFVDVAGFPAWWNAEGIYILTSGEAGGAGNPSVKSLTIGTIKDYYDSIPLTSKLQVRGYFHIVDGIIQWLFRSTEAGTPTEVYEYDMILNYNVFSSAFYLWRIPEHTVKINSIVVLDGTSGLVTQDNVIDDSANLVIDDTSNQVIAFELASTGGGATPVFKYLTSYTNGAGSYNVTFGDAEDATDYMDWVSYDDVGQDYSSTFTTGYKIRGQGNKRFQPLWVNLFSSTIVPTSYTFQGIWDYALNDGTNRTSSISTLSHTDTDYAVGVKRIKVRGHGKAIQFKVNSVSGFPFEIIGWTVMDTVNQLP